MAAELVTLASLEAYGYPFGLTGSNDQATMEAEIVRAGSEYLDAALSPDLADAFKNDSSEERFDQVKDSTVVNGVRTIGLTAGANEYCAFALLLLNSSNTSGSGANAFDSENMVSADPSNWLAVRYERARVAALQVAYIISTNSADFPEVTTTPDGLDTYNTFNF